MRDLIIVDLFRLVVVSKLIYEKGKNSNTNLCSFCMDSWWKSLKEEKEEEDLFFRYVFYLQFLANS